MADSQKIRVLHALKDCPDGLSTIELSLMCGTTRPANQIIDLRHDGYTINDVWVSAKNKYGENVHFVRYQLQGDLCDD